MGRAHGQPPVLLDVHGGGHPRSGLLALGAPVSRRPLGDRVMEGAVAGNSASFAMTVLAAVGLVRLWRKVFGRGDGWDDLPNPPSTVGRYGDAEKAAKR